MQVGGGSGSILLSRQTQYYGDKTSARDRSPREGAGPREIEMDPKLASAYRSISDMYNELKYCTIDEISKVMGVDPVSIFEKEKDRKPDLDTLISGLRYFLTRMLKYHVAIKEINDKKRERNNLAFGNEELLSTVEADLKTALREQEKLKLLLDTAHIKIKHLEKKNEELLGQTKKLALETQSEKMKLKSQIKNQTDQLKLLQEENLIIKRPLTGGPNTSSMKKLREIKPQRDTITLKEKEFFDRPSFDGLNFNSVKSANGLNESIKAISIQMDQNKLHNLQTKQDLKEFRRKVEQERDKELTTKQKDLLIARLNIQVEEREKDITRLKNDYDKIFQELKKMKEKEAEREREEWSKEILSDKNPNLIEHYKKKAEEKQEEIVALKKQLRKYAIGEKKVFIKEKAFELERADYQDKLTYLYDRVSKLSKINDDIRKSKDEGMSKDRYRKKREALNKSHTSSDDNNEGRPTAGGGLETIGTSGTIPDSYGKTPKVGFEKSAPMRGNKGYFH